jgi:hypothetical protein
MFLSYLQRSKLGLYKTVSGVEWFTTLFLGASHCLKMSDFTTLLRQTISSKYVCSWHFRSSIKDGSVLDRK